MCVVGEATVRLGVEGVRRLARRVERLREEYPEYLRPRLIVVIYTSLATREAVREAGERGMWVLKATRDLTEPPRLKEKA